MLIRDLPFYFRTTESANAPLPSGVPEMMDFEFEANLDLGLVRQRMTQERLAVLDRAYEVGADVGELNLDGDQARAGEFFAFIMDAHKDPKRVLEIGSGGGGMLKRLSTVASEKIVAIDPSPRAQGPALSALRGSAAAHHFIWAKFPHEEVTEHGPYDLILSSDVLEHVINPVKFLKAQSKLLGENGRIIFTVPNCSDSIRRGDISMALHQHISYFDYDSLTATLAGAGLVPENIVKAKAWGAYYVSCRPGGTSVSPSSLYKGLGARASRIQVRADRFIAECGNSNVGMYVPLRAAPYFPAAIRYGSVKMFDDAMRGKYLFGHKVYGLADLAGDDRVPIDVMLVASLTFEGEITQKLRPLKITVRTLNQMIASP